jgi:hypothetical protein
VGVGIIVGVAREMGATVGGTALAVATSLGSLDRRVGRAVGVSVGTRVRKATGVMKMLFVGSGADLPSRLLQPIKTARRIARATKIAAFR